MGGQLKLYKSMFCSPEVKWFGNKGYSADPDKIKLKLITEAGRPNTIEDICSFLQACSYNSKFAFEDTQPHTYQEITAPLRELFTVGESCQVWEDSDQALLKILSDKTALRPDLPIHFISDS